MLPYFLSNYMGAAIIPRPSRFDHALSFFERF